MMVSFNAQHTIIKNHLGQSLNERLSRLYWPVGVSMGDCLMMLSEVGRPGCCGKHCFPGQAV